MEQHFLNRILSQALAHEFPTDLWSTFKTLVAVSGGADSVALLRGLIENSDPQARENLVVVHVDHGTRDQQSQSDARFVAQLATNWGLEFHLVELPLKSSLDRTTALNSVSEESLRNQRYEALIETASKIGARYLVTGHHLNDQIETVLFRIFRGTGLSGLAGIPKYRVVNQALTIVRPLLSIRREQIEEYLTSIGQDFCRDASNESSDYTRNFLRNEVLPRLSERFGDVEGAIWRLSNQAAEANTFFDMATGKLNKSILKQLPTEVILDRRELAAENEFLLQRLFSNIWSQQKWPRKAMSASWWRQLVAAAKSESTAIKKLVLPGKITASFSERDIRLTTDKPQK